MNAPSVDPTEEPLLDANSPTDMLALGRRSLEMWRQTREGTAAERKAARLLAFAFGRLDSLGALDRV